MEAKLCPDGSYVSRISPKCEFTPCPLEKQNQVCFKNYCFNVELAKTAEEMKNGLMFRENMDSDRGMLFIFEKEGEYPFWMKNTLIPLDIIWINKDKEVVFISENAQPCEEGKPCLSVNPDKDAEYVLEVNGGTAEKIGLKVGDKITISIL
ncbi:hypothetical protein CO006_02210 [Candidatus Roizmanbacteria bacterium CG_4_8_14_3_um_filter_35_14]|nr:MAG: hypothetical protein CO006_02210 [Candidatus Roizmanbacteria bacterium CG_4_8_14_3_um_filter_35_14]